MTTPPPPATAVPSAASALSGHLDTRTAATEIAHMLHDALGDVLDLVVVFVSYHHTAAIVEALDIINQTLIASNLIAVTTEGVVGDDDELEGLAGMSAVAMRLPGATIHPWSFSPDDRIPFDEPGGIGRALGITPDVRSVVMFGDPFSTPITRLLPAIVSSGDGHPVPVIGGMASGASQPGHNVLALNGEVQSQGVVGVTISGDVSIDFVVSQGCRPIGAPYVVTKSERNVIAELGGHPAMDVLQEVVQTLPEGERELVQKGMLLGTVIDETRRPLGRGDFLVRSILGFDQQRKAIQAGEVLRPGQTVQFHVRDAVTAAEDLHLLLDAQQLKESPFAAMLFTCNGRGQRLFGEPNHDISIIRDRLGPVPIAGFLAAGEIGPVGSRSFLHGHTACLALFRRRLSSV